MYNSKKKDSTSKEIYEKCYGHAREDVVGFIHRFYISGAIRAPHEYVEMIDAIRHASMLDKVYIYINSTGGVLASGLQLINAINESQAEVITVLDGEAYSMAALIFLASPNVMVNPNSLMMLHTFSSDGCVGKSNEIEAQISASKEWFKTAVRSIAIPFISEEEAERIFRGEDIYFGSDEIVARLEARRQAIELEIDADELNLELIEQKTIVTKPRKKSKTVKTK